MATALELGPARWRGFAKIASTKPTQTRRPSYPLKEREVLFKRLQKAAAVLKTKFGVRRVILIGSLAHTHWFAPESDVDVVVEGLPDRLYWEAWKTLEDEIADRPVDLIDYKSAAKSLKQAINRHGIEL